MKKGKVSLREFLAELLKDNDYYVAVIHEDDTESISNPNIRQGESALKLTSDQTGPLIIYKMRGAPFLRNFLAWTKLRQWCSLEITAVAIASEQGGFAHLSWMNAPFAEKLSIMQENGTDFLLERAPDEKLSFSYEWNASRNRWQPVDPFKHKRRLTRREIWERDRPRCC